MCAASGQGVGAMQHDKLFSNIAFYLCRGQAGGQRERLEQAMGNSQYIQTHIQRYVKNGDRIRDMIVIVNIVISVIIVRT